jgi:RNA 3'-terminal phosphate cyclase (ATP)
MSTDVLRIDGAHGEGGGQIVRSAVALAALAGRTLELERIRAGRARPGLGAQHLTAVRAVAALVGAELAGAELGSQWLRFEPAHQARAGDFRFDVGAARPGGSAGSAALILQSVSLPLFFAGGLSTLAIAGGTHVPASPTFDDLRGAWAPALACIGLELELELSRPGWYPAGQGELVARLRGLDPQGAPRLAPLVLLERGALRRIHGRALASGLPAHVPQRMAARALSLLRGEGLSADVRAELAPALSPGAGLFLAAEYEAVTATFSALGRPGKPSEIVAEEAVAALFAHHRSGAAVERHLADQLVLPASLVPGRSELAVEAVTRHLLTCAWVVEQFELARVAIEGQPGEPGRVRIEGKEPRP